MRDEKTLPLGLRIRRARVAAGLSQRELAHRAGVSQPLVSYYERVGGEARGPGLAQIAAVLGIDVEEAVGVSAAAVTRVEASGSGLSWLQALRVSLLHSIKESGGLDAALLDEPGEGPGGDVAFASDLGSHLLIVVLDGTGGGAQACVAALLQAAALLGAEVAHRGVLWPDDLLRATTSLSRRFGVRRFASGFVALIDRRHGELTWALDGFPAPWLRAAGRTSPLRGDREGRVEAGRVSLVGPWMLLVATDGVAHAATRRERVLWEGRDVRDLVSRARRPTDVIEGLAGRLLLPPGGHADDRLAIALAPSRALR